MMRLKQSESFGSSSPSLCAPICSAGNLCGRKESCHLPSLQSLPGSVQLEYLLPRSCDPVISRTSSCFAAPEYSLNEDEAKRSQRTQNWTTFSTKEYESAEALLECLRVTKDVENAVDVISERQCQDKVITFSKLLQRCVENRDFVEGKRLHFSLIMNGLDYDSSFGAPLIRMYTFFEKTTEAVQVFSKLREPNLFSWTAIISAYGKCGQTDEVLKLYALLQASAVHLDGHSFVAVLQACSISSALHRGRIVHSHVIESGWELDIHVGSTIIDMYSNCESVADAHAVFKRLPRGNLVTWSALMKGYSQIYCSEEVIQIFRQMQQQGVNPDEITFIGVLKACSSKVFNDAQNIHASIINSGFELNAWVSNALIDFYVRCKDFEAARIIFSKMPGESPVAYSCMMAGYVHHDDGHRALQLYEQFQNNHMQPDLVIFVCTLQACTSTADLNYGQYVQGDIIDSGYDGNLVIGSSVIDLYAKCGEIADAQRQFLRLPARNIVTWNALITGYSQHEHFDEVLHFIEQLQGEGLSPDSVTFGSVLKVCTSFGTLKRCRQIHVDIVQRGLDLDTSISNTLIDMYSKQGRLADAHTIFGNMPSRDVVAWTSLIRGYIEHDKFSKAFQLFELMQMEGSKPDSVAFACILKACCTFADIDQGRRLHSEVVRSGWEEDPFLGNTLIEMYVKCGSLKDACKIFSNVENRSVVAWNSILSGYIQNDNAEEAIKLFRRMQTEGVDINLVTFICCLKACSCVAAVELGQYIHRCLIERGCEMDVIAGSSLINMYAKCGSLSDAHTLFDRLAQKNTVTWTALLSGDALHKNYHSAVESFQRMEKEGFKPDDIAFLCLLSACSYSSDLVEQGCLHFKSMLADYCLQPSVDHCNALIEMFGHANYLNQAEDLIETMPFRKNSTGWTSLQSACKNHGNVDVGRRCFNELIKMDPENTSSYTLMAATYEEAGMFEDARRVEKLRKQTNGWKKPAKSFIEIDREVHGFVVGDQAHPKSFDIYSKLATIDTQMKKERYEPCANVVNSTDWEAKVCGHSERLAIAFGLLSTTQGTTIRVSKNLRMCSDCHLSTKYISKLEMREIVVADTYCIHHFNDGQCSCDRDSGYIVR